MWQKLGYTNLRPDLEPTSLIHSDVTYFVDGSYYKDHFGYHACYAVVEKVGETFVTVKAESCEHHGRNHFVTFTV